MAAQSSAPATRGFWIVSGIFLVWNLMGVMAFVMQVTMSQEALAALPEAQRNLYTGIPAWATAAYAVAVFGGTLGCVFLLLRKAWAVPVLILSLAGVVVQMFHAFFLTPALEVLGAGSLAMPILITAGAVFLIWYASRAKAGGVIG
jgi:hypothetical protein